MTLGAVIAEIGVVARSGKTCSVRERQISSAYAGVTESFLSSNHAAEIFSKVCSVAAFFACRSASRFSLGSSPWATSSLASTVLLRA
ncbi:hypothetical protein D3C84_678630 [compost metagenome]